MKGALLAALLAAAAALAACESSEVKAPAPALAKGEERESEQEEDSDSAPFTASPRPAFEFEPNRADFKVRHELRVRRETPVSGAASSVKAGEYGDNTTALRAATLATTTPAAVGVDADKQKKLSSASGLPAVSAYYLYVLAVITNLAN